MKNSIDSLVQPLALLCDDDFFRTESYLSEI